MYDYDAVDLLDFQRNPHRNDHLRAYEYDLRKIQEIIPSNIHTRSSVYLEIHLDLNEAKALRRRGTLVRDSLRPHGFQRQLKTKMTRLSAESFLSAQSLRIIEPLLMTYIRFLNLWNGIKNGIDK